MNGRPPNLPYRSRLPGIPDDRAVIFCYLGAMRNEDVLAILTRALVAVGSVWLLLRVAGLLP